MFNYILRAIGLTAVGCIAGVGVSESIIVARKAKKLAQAYQDMKTLERIKEAAKERVEEIKKDPREIIFPLYAGFASGMAWAAGNWNGWNRGFKDGIFEGIRHGILGLERELIGKCPREFRKFIDIIMRNGFPEEVNVYQQKTGPKADDFRWWGWSPAKLLKDWDALAIDAEKAQEVEA